MSPALLLATAQPGSASQQAPLPEQRCAALGWCLSSTRGGCQRSAQHYLLPLSLCCGSTGWHSSEGLPPALVNDFQTPQPPPRALNFLLDLALLPGTVTNPDGSSMGFSHAPPAEHPFHLPSISTPLVLVDPKPSLWVTTAPPPPRLVLGL